MKIVVVSAFFSEGMGYTENCLPKSLSALGHEVHLVTSTLNIYGNLPSYNQIYRSFLGEADQGVKTFRTDGYTVHRLPYRLISGYVYIQGLYNKIKAIRPDIVHSIEIGSILTFALASFKIKLKYKLFTESHQHLSIIRPYLKKAKGHYIQKFFYKITRTWPSFCASLTVERCYAIAPDCVYVANRFYGVPSKKIQLQSLGTDVELFHPVSNQAESEKRIEMRSKYGFTENDVVCIYSGRFSADKNPLILANAIDTINKEGLKFRGFFIGDGEQASEINNFEHSVSVKFMNHLQLSEHYRMADIAVWPMQESMSMLDAAASGLPLIVSNKIGEFDRISGNGKTYNEGDVTDLLNVLKSLDNYEMRREMGNIARKKMVVAYNWSHIASGIIRDYQNSLTDK